MTEVFLYVPARLQSALDHLPSELRRDDLPYHMTSELVMLEYLGKLPQESEAFLEYSVTADGKVGPSWTTKVGLIGKWLFELRQCSGFPEICRRMRERSLREVYYELFSAHQFHKNDFDVKVRQEVRRKGDDFDFSATRYDEIINVEVTAFTKPEFSEQTVRNALDAKRKQLSASAPGIVICVVPQTWWSGSSRDLAEELGKVAKAFLRGTGRVNCVAFFLESQQAWDGMQGATGAVRAYERYPFFNVKPRMPVDTGQLFVDEHPAIAKLRLAIAHGQSIKTIAAELRDSEFYRWVDDAMLRTSSNHE